jgi:diguanylate cyclase (GGDEF)-like protein
MENAGFVLGLAAGALTAGVPATIAAMRFASIARERARKLREHAMADRARSSLVVQLSSAAHRGVTDVQQCIVDLAAAAVGDARGVLLFASRSNELVCVRTAGDRFANFTHARIALDGDAPAARAALARHRVRSVAATSLGWVSTGLQSLAVPLLIDERQTGVLEIVTARTLSDREADRIAIVAEQGALAWRVACERERDRRRAERDALTGLLTPAELRRRLSALIARMQSAPAARCSLLFIDTDRFKEWNDAYGHAAGDALLCAIAGLLSAAARVPDDLVARNGGDEFCIALVDTEKPDGIAHADRLRAQIAMLDLSSIRPPNTIGPSSSAASVDSFRITASIGVAAYPGDGASASDLLERADAAMYHSKRAGRDAVSFVDTDGRLAAIRAGVSVGALPA